MVKVTDKMTSADSGSYDMVHVAKGDHRGRASVLVMIILVTVRNCWEHGCGII